MLTPAYLEGIFQIQCDIKIEQLAEMVHKEKGKQASSDTINLCDYYSQKVLDVEFDYLTVKDIGTMDGKSMTLTVCYDVRRFYLGLLILADGKRHTL